MSLTSNDSFEAPGFSFNQSGIAEEGFVTSSDNTAMDDYTEDDEYIDDTEYDEDDEYFDDDETSDVSSGSEYDNERIAMDFTPVEAAQSEGDDMYSSDEDMPKDPALMDEYNATFSGEEQVAQLLHEIEGKFTTSLRDIPVDSIILPKFKKEMRRKTIIGLTGLVSTLAGVVSPVHVMTMEDADDEFTLLDGTRRLYAAIKSGDDTIPAVVWDFEDKDQGTKLRNILGLMLNRSQMMSNSEKWNTMRVLETANACTPGRIEFLLQLQAGDAMKLKDIMLAEGDGEVAELKDKFLNDEMTIDAAYKKLANLRKKEDRLARDEERSIDLNGTDSEDYSSGGGGRHMGPQMPDEAPKPRLNNEEVLELLEMGAEDVTNQALEAMKAKGDAMRGEMEGPHVQEVGKRHPVDSAIRTATFKRDGFKCRCCGIGGELYLSILVFHHAVPVFAGGPDTVENGLTLCANCHLTLHNYVDGHLHGDLADYSEEDQQTLKNIFKYGNIAIQAAKKMGLKRSQVHELDAESRKHIMPDKNVKANNESYVAAGRDDESSDFDLGLDEGGDT